MEIIRLRHLSGNQHDGMVYECIVVDDKQLYYAIERDGLVTDKYLPMKLRKVKKRMRKALKNNREVAYLYDKLVRCAINGNM